MEGGREFCVWRVAADGGLHRSGSIQAKRVWLADQQQDVASVSSFLAQAHHEHTTSPNLGIRCNGAAFKRGSTGSGSLFQTGTGKSVQVSSAAMKRALALLGEDTTASSCKRANAPAAAGVCEAKLIAAAQAPAAGKPEALFRTATGRPVGISASAMSKAKALLQENQGGNAPASTTFRPHQPSFSITSAGSLKKLPASVPPFKQPRRLRFTSPLSGGYQQATKLNFSPAKCELKNKSRLLSLMPLELNAVPRENEFKMPPRIKLQEYFQQPPRRRNHEQAFHIGREIQLMTSDGAREHRFRSEQGESWIGPLDLRDMLLKAGAKPHLATKEWVENHYRWIVWKLACQERRSSQCARRLLTLNNVLHELKYRYIREIGFGHRSTIKKICERDSSAAQTMLLCVSAIRRRPVLNEKSEAAKVEVTDGWYSLNAILDAPLTRQMQAGKLFVGQKLRISQAVLIGVDEGLPPLEAFDVASLVLHINGTYRTHWADRLGTCRHRPLPLALKCIKQDGGSVPLTCIAVSRIYPLLYRERLADGNSIVRSARAEHFAQHSFEHRRASVAEATTSMLEKEDLSTEDDELAEEGARLFKSLEYAADPEVMMADMTSEQHAALSTYQARKKFMRQAAVEKSVHRALEDAQLLSRDVTPLIKVRVTGLQSKANKKESISRDGLITIWEPSDCQMADLVEGGIYTVSSLKPAPLGPNPLLHLSTTKSSKWQQLSGTTCQAFQFTFSPRAAVHLSDLVDVPTHSEFDAAVLVLHVGEVYKSGPRNRQWVFVSDGSLQYGQVALLAINFSDSVDAFSRFDSAFTGTVVGFCNLVKREPDEKNSMSVAEASNLSIYSSKLSSKAFCHLGRSAALVTRWAKSSPEMGVSLRLRIQELITHEAA